MTLAYHGRNVSPEEVRRATGTSRDGVNALALVEAAGSYGMEARGVSVELDALGHLQRGTILHWEFNHFVVLDRVRKGGIDVLDPALGRVHVPMERVSKAFTGVAITLEPTAAFERGSNAASGAWRYIKPMLKQSGLLSKVGITSFLIQLFALATPILMGVIVDRVVQPPGDRDLLLAVALGMLAMVGFHFLSTFVRSHLLVTLRAQLDMNISTGFISHLVKLPYQFFLQRSAGDLMARLNSNITVREILTTGAISTVLDGVLVSIYLVLIFAQNTAMGLVVVALGLLQVAILAFTHRKMQRLMAETLQAEARSQGYLAQMITGIETLKAVGAEARGVAQWSNLFVDEVNATVSRGRLSALIETLTTTLRIASPLVVLTVGTLSVLNGDISLGTMLALTALATGFLTPLSSLIVTGTQLQLLGSYMERINDVLDTATEQDADAVPAPKLSGQVSVREVSFRYADSGPDVIDDVSLDIEAGQMIGIVGRSGSGKSTLAHLILSLYRPTVGAVLYDGMDLRGLEATSVRGQLGIVPQNSYLFGTSVRGNIALTKPDASLEEIERAARIACIHDDVMAMPMGYDTVLSDGGSSISGGQRQRIALARALVHEPAILLLDEATSSLDAVTEAAIYNNLEHLDCTRIVIAHRISTIARADLIVVMEEGRFVEKGPHEQLMSIEGLYYDLARSRSAKEPSR
jgi:ABC-type bacteriocin/lantibiotic exporter with double-glycine peptidase domain